MDAAQDLDERRLAGAVLTDQRVDLAAVQRQVHPVQHPDAGERLADAAGDQERPLGFADLVHDLASPHAK
jgi:hypothetical protein